MTIGQNKVPTWIHILANAHDLQDYKGIVAYILRYELRDSQAGKAQTLFAGFLMLFVISLFSMFALAAPVGLLVSDTLAQMDPGPARVDAPAAEIVSYDGLADDITNSMMEITKASQDYSVSHGLEHHGEAAAMVRDCIAKKGPAQTWEDPDGHRIQICQLPNGQIGFQVEVKRDGVFKPITEYIKQRFHSLADVARYMRNGGAVMK
jgi:putative hemolysin